MRGWGYKKNWLNGFKFRHSSSEHGKHGFLVTLKTSRFTHKAFPRVRKPPLGILFQSREALHRKNNRQ